MASFSYNLYLEKRRLAPMKKIVPFFYDQDIPSYDTLKFLYVHCFQWPENNNNINSLTIISKEELVQKWHTSSVLYVPIYLLNQNE